MNTITNFINMRSITIKLVLVFILTVLLLIPQFMILNLIKERMNRQQDVKIDIADKWGTSQTLIGPILKIPYIEVSDIVVNSKKNKQINNQQSKNQFTKELSNEYWAYFLPDKLAINGDIQTQKLYRSIYEVVVYDSHFNIKGTFSNDKIKKWAKTKNNILWGKAKLIFAISDQKGVKKLPELTWNNTKISCIPGVYDISFKQMNYRHFSYATTPNITNGLTSSIDLNLNKINTFSLSLYLSGSESISFTPLGKNTKVALTSNWSSPSFKGNFLPLPEGKKINNSGFKANWVITEFNRSFPPFWEKNKTLDIVDSQFGVYLKQEANHYQKSERSIKYMFLIVALVFLTFFLTEAIKKLRIHVFQYIMVGVAISVFFILLLALSEYVGYDYSYFIAAIATIGLISLYSLSFLPNKKNVLLLILLQLIVFSYIYVITQMEERALLVGAIGLFVITALTMYISRKINWSKS